MSDPIKNFQAEVDSVFSAAIKSAKGGDANWNSFLTSYSITPLTQQQKEALLNSEMKIAGGAFPIEVRWVLQAVVMKHASFAEINPDVKNLLLQYNLDGEVMKYYTRIKPFGGMSDIFKNAKSTTKNYSEGIGAAKKSVIRCKNCGAPRLETMQYDNCLFCGSELFETKEE
jgi:hypothetical protein